jgi:hypothetical protein
VRLLRENQVTKLGVNASRAAEQQRRTEAAEKKEKYIVAYRRRTKVSDLIAGSKVTIRRYIYRKENRSK